MNHITDIRLVDTHTESDRSHDHIRLFHQEGILIGGTYLRIHSRMVRQRLYPVGFQDVGKFLHLFTAQTIYDTRFTLVGFNILNDLAVYIRSFRTNLIIQIRAVEG